MSPGGLEGVAALGEKMYLILGDKPRKGVPFVTFSECVFYKETNRENAFSNMLFLFFLDLGDLK